MAVAPVTPPRVVPRSGQIIPFGRSIAPLPPAPSGVAQRLPWILVGALVVAVAALVAYIVTW